MKTEHVTYSCDKCSLPLKTSGGLNIRTSLKEDGYWSRLHVRIEHRHGLHNNGKSEAAELCKGCTLDLLEDAVRRVRFGERVSAGTEGIEAQTF
jgi:hypothetical protein